jgi:hypothetical protein
MKPMMKTLLWILFPITLMAHPGHGSHRADHWQHYLTNPEHVLHILLGVVLLVLLSLVVRNELALRAARNKDRDA